MPRAGWLALGVFMLGSAATAQAQADWTTYGGAPWNQRWSTLTQINTRNVKSLVPTMVFQTGTKPGSFEVTPIVSGDTMFVTTAYDEAFIAYDLNTGKEIWRYEYKLAPVAYCCGPDNRGVALADGKVFFGTLDGHVIALDSKTGQVVWDQQIADPDSRYSITAAPIVVRNKVIGVSGGEYGEAQVDYALRHGTAPPGGSGVAERRTASGGRSPIAHSTVSRRGTP
jgi:glucose dehydrogenase